MKITEIRTTSEETTFTITVANGEIRHVLGHDFSYFIAVYPDKLLGALAELAKTNGEAKPR